MKKFLISAAAAAAALTAAAPAAAQYYPPQGQGYGYGYNQHYGQSRHLLNRIERIKDRINHLDRRNILSERESDRLKGEANDIRRLVRRIDNNGLSPWERQNVERRIARLEWRIQRDARDGNRWGDRRYGYGDRDHDGRYGYGDRDRDGHYDRWEDDRGRDHDD